MSHLQRYHLRYNFILAFVGRYIVRSFVRSNSPPMGAGPDVRGVHYSLVMQVLYLVRLSKTQKKRETPFKKIQYVKKIELGHCYLASFILYMCWSWKIYIYIYIYAILKISLHGLWSVEYYRRIYIMNCIYFVNIFTHANSLCIYFLCVYMC